MRKFVSRVSKHALFGCLLITYISAYEAPQSTAPSEAAPLSYRYQTIKDDVIYFTLPDRFANGDTANDRGRMGGNALVYGFDPPDKRFCHDGDVKGFIEKLDYLQEPGFSTLETSTPETAFVFTHQLGDAPRHLLGYIFAIKTPDTARDIQLPSLSGNRFRVLNSKANHGSPSTGPSIKLEA